MKTKVLYFLFLLNTFFVNAQNDNSQKKLRTWNYEDLKICREKTGKQTDITQYLLSDDKEYYYTYDKILLQEVATKWVKKDADRNCLSADPNDCLVWCLIEVPAVYSNGEKITVSAKEVTIEGHRKYLYEMVETICLENITEEMFDVLVERLIRRGYIPKINKNESQADYAIFCREELFDALGKYQKSKHLAQGFFDIETLKMIGIITK